MQQKHKKNQGESQAPAPEGHNGPPEDVDDAEIKRLTNRLHLGGGQELLDGFAMSGRLTAKSAALGQLILREADWKKSACRAISQDELAKRLYLSPRAVRVSLVELQCVSWIRSCPRPGGMTAFKFDKRAMALALKELRAIPRAKRFTAEKTRFYSIVERDAHLTEHPEPRQQVPRCDNPPLRHQVPTPRHQVPTPQARGAYISTLDLHSSASLSAQAGDAIAPGSGRTSPSTGAPPPASPGKVDPGAAASRSSPQARVPPPSSAPSPPSVNGATKAYADNTNRRKRIKKTGYEEIEAVGAETREWVERLMALCAEYCRDDEVKKPVFYRARIKGAVEATSAVRVQAAMIDIAGLIKADKLKYSPARILKKFAENISTDQARKKIRDAGAAPVTGAPDVADDLQAALRRQIEIDPNGTYRLRKKNGETVDEIVADIISKRSKANA